MLQWSLDAIVVKDGEAVKEDALSHRRCPRLVDSTGGILVRRAGNRHSFLPRILMRCGGGNVVMAAVEVALTDFVEFNLLLLYFEKQ